jgi:mRNA-degrading endonuclease toxin of MazEF toxin-antitoxin module
MPSGQTLIRREARSRREIAAVHRRVGGRAQPVAPLALSLVVPMTPIHFSDALHVEIERSQGGLRERSFAMREQLRALSHERISKRLGQLRPATLTELLRRYSCFFVIRRSPSGRRAVGDPSQTGMSPAWPHCWLCWFPVELSITNHVPELGRHTAKSVLTSLS